MQISGEDCIFTWVPRKYFSIAQSGLDQGQKLCYQIAAGFGKKPCQLFSRVGGKEQKTLNGSERDKNAEKSIALNYKLSHIPSKPTSNIEEFIKGKNIVIIDDIITTGATLKNAVTLLQKAGAGKVIVTCIAKTRAVSGKYNKKN